MTFPVRRVPTSGRSRGRPAGLFVVTDTEREVIVRFSPRTASASLLWRCTGCDTKAATTECLHTFSVAVYLAETELGLARVHELEETHA